MNNFLNCSDGDLDLLPFYATVVQDLKVVSFFTLETHSSYCR